MTTNRYSVQLSEKEKQLFEEWLQNREESLQAQLQELQQLRLKLNPDQPDQVIIKEEKVVTEKPVPIPVYKPAPKVIDNKPSWTNKIIAVFNQLNRSLISKEIIDWFIQNDASVQNKSREFVSKSVTSKLAVLEEKGILKKEIVDKKHVYTMVRASLLDNPEPGLF